MVAVSTNPPCEETVTVVEPTLTAVTFPLVRPTAATPGLADDHSTTAETSTPWEFRRMAERYATSPTSKVEALGLIEIVTGGNGSSPTSSVTTLSQETRVVAAMTQIILIGKRSACARRTRLDMVHLQRGTVLKGRSLAVPSKVS